MAVAVAAEACGCDVVVSVMTVAVHVPFVLALRCSGPCLQTALGADVCRPQTAGDADLRGPQTAGCADVHRPRAAEAAVVDRGWPRFFIHSHGHELLYTCLAASFRELFAIASLGEF